VPCGPVAVPFPAPLSPPGAWVDPSFAESDAGEALEPFDEQCMTAPAQNAQAPARPVALRIVMVASARESDIVSRWTPA
jgi:hypothetical protein